MNITSNQRLNMLINNNHILDSLEMYDNKFIDNRINLHSVKKKLRNVSEISNPKLYDIKIKEINYDILHILDIINKHLDNVKAYTVNDVDKKIGLNAMLSKYSRNLNSNNKILEGFSTEDVINNAKDSASHLEPEKFYDLIKKFDPEFNEMIYERGVDLRSTPAGELGTEWADSEIKNTLFNKHDKNIKQLNKEISNYTPEQKKFRKLEEKAEIDLISEMVVSDRKRNDLEKKAKNNFSYFILYAIIVLPFLLVLIYSISKNSYSTLMNFMFLIMLLVLYKLLRYIFYYVYYKYNLIVI